MTDVEKGKKPSGHKCPKCGTRHQSVRQYVNRNKPIVAPAPDWLPDPDGDGAAKSYLGDPYPGQQYAAHRTSEPLSAGRAAAATDDHGVGAGRNPGLAAHHGDLRQSSPAAFDAVTRLMTQNAEGNGDRGITWYGGEAVLRTFNARGQAGSYGGMQGIDPSPQRPESHIARNSATPPNGSHSTANANRPPVQSMKASDRVEIMRRAMFPGSGGSR